MTAIRQFFVASVLALTLTVSISAGEISTGITSPQTTPTAQGDIHTMNADAEAGDSVADAAVALIESVLSMF
jgi:hypothetical protein